MANSKLKDLSMWKYAYLLYFRTEQALDLKNIGKGLNIVMFECWGRVLSMF